MTIGDTIEFDDTIIKIDSIIADGQYAIVPAGLFDVFSELEIDTSMVMESNTQHQLGATTQYNTDLLKSVRNISSKYNSLDEAGCLPKGRNNITVHGIVNKHHYRNAHYNGVQLELENCKLYETENGSITTDQSINVGLRASRIYINSHEKSLKFYIDGASLLAGNLNVDFDSKGSRVRTKNRLATYKPTIIKGLEASKLDSLAHLLNTEIYLDLENSIKGEFKGSTSIQVPADFAIGMDALFDEKADKWKFNSYKLVNDKMIDIDKQALGVGYNVEVMNLEIGSAVSAGDKFKIDASSPWFKENDKANNLQKLIQEIKDDNKALFTADLAVNSFDKVSAGFMLDTTAGSQVAIEDCKANLKAVTGLHSYNSFIARAGSGLIMANAPTINRNVFTDPSVLFKWNLFNVYDLKKEDWCGPLSKLKGKFGGNGSRVFVSDADGKVIYDVKYIQKWNKNKKTQAGLFQVGATISETDKLWQNLQNFATPTEVAQEFTLPTKVPKGLLNLSFDDDSTKYSMDDEGWAFAWKTFNLGITITDDKTRTPGFEIDCEGNCTDDPILLVVKSPDDKYAYLQFKPAFADALIVEATAKATQSDLALSAEANYSGAKYTWKTSDGKVLITQKPELTIPSTSEFATQALIDGNVTLVAEALGQSDEVIITIEEQIDSPIPASSKLPATGITLCANADKTNIVCNMLTGDWKGLLQDGEMQAGLKMSYTVLNQNGAECVRDNVTGLIWEQKTDDGGLRDKDNTYSWYNPDSTTNGGDAGTQDGLRNCKGSACDTKAYIQALNDANYCGYSDWRIPTIDELVSIVDYGRTNPAINTIFTNTPSSKYTNNYWSSSSFHDSVSSAWYVNFQDGYFNDTKKGATLYVRSVRSE